MAKTFFSLFRGGNLVSVGAESAGLVDIGGIEYDKEIAAVCDVNFPDSPTTVADVREVDPTLLPCGVPDILHASPSCRTASGANQSAEVNEAGLKETQEDKESGLAICRFLDCWIPPVFTLENVWGYRNYGAFGHVCNTLCRLGYSYDFWHLNAADYGVPQTRKRLILIAKLGKGQRILKPTPTHHNPKDYNPGQLSMFQPATLPWKSWYSAILDLIPTLPDSQFAPWQLERLPKGLLETSLAERHGAFNLQENDRITIAREIDPIWTVRASKRATEMATAFIVDQNYGNSNASEDMILSIRQSDEPMVTVTAGSPKREYRAWLIGSENAGQEWGGTRFDNQPAMTLTQEQKPRAWLSEGRVVSMNVRALARFQGIPDSYDLPGNKRLACAIIGNAVPPLLYQKIIRDLID